MNSKIGRRQQAAWCAAAASVPAVMTCAGRSWQWVLLGCGAAAVFFAMLGAAMRGCGSVSVSTAVLRAFGAKAGGAILILGAAWTTLAAADAAAKCAGAFPSSDLSRLAPPVLLALCALSGKNGARSGARCAAVAAPVLILLYMLITVCALPGVRTQWLRPWGAWTQATEVLAPMLVPAAALYLPSTKEKNVPWGALLLLALLPAGMAAVTSGYLSPALVQAERFSYYTLTKNMSLLSVMERFEPVLSGSLFVGYFCLASLLVESASAQLGAAIGKWHGGRRTIALCAAAYGLSYAADRIPDAIRTAGSAVFWGLMPSLALLIVAIKKVRKKAKK